jgi:hypothetical protein
MDAIRTTLRETTNIFEFALNGVDAMLFPALVQFEQEPFSACPTEKEANLPNFSTQDPVPIKT